jgi:hypothetical protein
MVLMRGRVPGAGNRRAIYFYVICQSICLTSYPYTTEVNVPRQQPVPFSHNHHANMGIDCRYCHTSVEEAGHAGIPPTKTCMNCHSMIWSESPMLEPVREELPDRRVAGVDPRA